MSDKHYPLESFQDARGETVRVGDTIAWAVNTYDWLTLKIGKVQEIYHIENRHGGRELRIKAVDPEGLKPSVLWFEYRIVKLVD